MEKYIPIQTKSKNINHNQRIYNLPVSYLPLFRKEFGVSYYGVTDDQFVKWCKDNDVTLYKTVLETVKVKIDEY